MLCVPVHTEVFSMFLENALPYSNIRGHIPTCVLNFFFCSALMLRSSLFFGQHTVFTADASLGTTSLNHG